MSAIYKFPVFKIVTISVVRLWSLPLSPLCMVIGYQVDEFTCTWSAEWFVAYSYMYPGIMDKLSSLTHFPHEPGCEEYSFLDQAIWDFEEGFDSILTDSARTLGLNTFLDEHDVITSSFSSAFLHSGSPASDTFKPQLASSIRSFTLWCKAGGLLSPVSLATRMLASKLIHYFSKHPATFGFQSSTSPDNITLNTAKRKADQCLLELRLALVWLVLPLSIWSSSFLTRELHLLIPVLLYQILKEECMNYLSQFMTFFTMQCPYGLVTQLIFFSTFLILLLGSVVKFGFHSSHFYTVSRTWFLLVRLTSLVYKLVSSTGSATGFHWLVSVFSPYERCQSKTQDWVPFKCAKETCGNV